MGVLEYRQVLVVQHLPLKLADLHAADERPVLGYCALDCVAALVRATTYDFANRLFLYAFVICRLCVCPEATEHWLRAVSLEICLNCLFLQIYRVAASVIFLVDGHLQLKLVHSLDAARLLLFLKIKLVALDH